MRLKVSFFADGIIELDCKYNLRLRGLIYSLLPDNYASFLHDMGFQYEKRKFRLFTFSRIFGKRARKDIEKSNKNDRRYFLFEQEIHFYVASPINKILQHVAGSLVKTDCIKIGRNKLYLKGIEVFTPRDFGEKVRVKMLSPMTVRSTLYSKDGKRKSYYYSPYEEEFSQLITGNLQKKYFVVNGKLSTGSVRVIPVKPGNERVIKGDNDFVIKAWDGVYELVGDPELIKLSYDAGLGEKNSQGFGMWEVAKGCTAETRRINSE